MAQKEVRTPHRSLSDKRIEEFVAAAIADASVEELEDGSGLYAHVPALEGVWGSGESNSKALEDLKSALRDWVVFKVERGHEDIPVVSGIDLNRG